ncbi:hypothetical protein [Mycobacterium sp.]|uniref:hypothetical protein n=1 Tax=Mycobacterium sp. TaxID=1785 RepID=UPI002613A313|nr:hypothetical protein [Mycobacterium sp.]
MTTDRTATTTTTTDQDGDVWRRSPSGVYVNVTACDRIIAALLKPTAARTGDHR